MVGNCADGPIYQRSHGQSVNCWNSFGDFRSNMVVTPPPNEFIFELFIYPQMVSKSNYVSHLTSDLVNGRFNPNWGVGDSLNCKFQSFKVSWFQIFLVSKFQRFTNSISFFKIVVPGYKLPSSCSLENRSHFLNRQWIFIRLFILVRCPSFPNVFLAWFSTLEISHTYC